MIHDYESLIILNPDAMTDEGIRKDTLDYYKSLYEQLSLRKIDFEVWGEKRLAYPIKDPRTGKSYSMGYYIKCLINAEDTVPNVLEQMFGKHDCYVIKSLTVNADDGSGESRLPDKDSEEEITDILFPQKDEHTSEEIINQPDAWDVLLGKATYETKGVK